MFEGSSGEEMKEIDIPENYKDLVEEKRMELIETLADLDSEIEELYLAEEEISAEVLNKVIRE